MRIFFPIGLSRKSRKGVSGFDMDYLLDTNICIAALRGNSPRLVERIALRKNQRVSISAITLAELFHGAMRSARPAYHESLIIAFCAPLKIADFDSSAGRVYGVVRRQLEQAGRPIGPLDNLIAAHALALGATLVTSNIREFNRIPALRVEAW